MSDQADHRFSTLETTDYSIIENLLAGMGIAYPILAPDNVPADLAAFYSGWSDWAHECIRATRERFSIKADVRYCLIGTPKANAFATRVSDRYFVALHIGIIWQRVFAKLLTTARLQTYFGLSDPSQSLLDEHALTLASLAFRWIVFHELGHIKNGHLHLSTKQAYGASSTEKMEMTPDQLDRNITKHCLEMDADTFACAQLSQKCGKTIIPHCSQLTR